MYLIEWFDGDKVHTATTGDNESAWGIYWALKELYKNGRPMFDIWIKIHNGSVFCNPERGGALPFCKGGEGPRFILALGDYYHLTEQEFEVMLSSNREAIDRLNLLHYGKCRLCQEAFLKFFKERELK